MATQPPRSMRVGLRVKCWCLRSAKARQRIGVAGCRSVRRVRSKRRYLDEKGLPRRLSDETDRHLGKYVRQIVTRVTTVANDFAILVEKVVKLGVGASANQPRRPTQTSGIEARVIAVEIL